MLSAIISLNKFSLFFSLTSFLDLYNVNTPLTMEFARQEYWGELPFPSPGDLPNPGIEPRSPVPIVSSVQLLIMSNSATPWTAACQASQFFSNCTLQRSEMFADVGCMCGIT